MCTIVIANMARKNRKPLRMSEIRLKDSQSCAEPHKVPRRILRRPQESTVNRCKIPRSVGSCLCNGSFLCWPEDDIRDPDEDQGNCTPNSGGGKAEQDILSNRVGRSHDTGKTSRRDESTGGEMVTSILSVVGVKTYNRYEENTDAVWHSALIGADHSQIGAVMYCTVLPVYPRLRTRVGIK